MIYHTLQSTFRAYKCAVFSCYRFILPDHTENYLKNCLTRQSAKEMARLRTILNWYSPKLCVKRTHCSVPLCSNTPTQRPNTDASLQLHTSTLYCIHKTIILIFKTKVLFPSWCSHIAHIYTRPCSFFVKSITSENTRFVVAWYKTDTTSTHVYMKQCASTSIFVIG
jgi:hypothetical protein